MIKIDKNVQPPHKNYRTSKWKKLNETLENMNVGDWIKIELTEEHTEIGLRNIVYGFNRRNDGAYRIRKESNTIHYITRKE